MRVERLDPPGLLLVHAVVHRDERGSFQETWSRRRYMEAGLPDFVQDNLVYSKRGVLRGLHYQEPREQGKLVTVVAGEVFDVAADIRVGSPTFGKWTGLPLSGDRGVALYVPPGFAHGYAVLSETAVVSYKCTDYYEPTTENCVLWSDPTLGIDWPISDPMVSARDGAARPLSGIPPDRLPVYGE